MSAASELMAAHHPVPTAPAPAATAASASAPDAASAAADAAGLALDAAGTLSLIPDGAASSSSMGASTFHTGGFSGMAAGADSVGLSDPAASKSLPSLARETLTRAGGAAGLLSGEDPKGPADGEQKTPRGESAAPDPEGIYSEKDLLGVEHVLLKYEENKDSLGYNYGGLLPLVVQRLMDRSWNTIFDLKFVNSIFRHRHDRLIRSLISVFGKIAEFRELSREYRQITADSSPDASALFQFRQWYDRNPEADISSRDTVMNDRKYMVAATIMMQQFMAIANGYCGSRIEEHNTAFAARGIKT